MPVRIPPWSTEGRSPPLHRKEHNINPHGIHPPRPRHRFVVISGCSGGGKSALLAELARRGLGIIDEPGRRIVADALAGDGAALPWVDAAAFARKAMDVARADLARAETMTGRIVFDRGLVDAAAALQHATGMPVLDEPGLSTCYTQEMFLAPPWPEIYVGDSARRHDFVTAAAEYERLAAAYAALGYRPIVLPKVDVSARADFVVRRLAA